jgi:Zn-dependent protease
MLSLLAVSPILFVVYLVALVVAVTIHEFAHAWTADKLGDPTPRIQGRVTLDPGAHLDPLGTLFMVLTRFGWGRPVEFDPYNLREPLRDTALIALAGPISNLTLASVLALGIQIGVLPGLLGAIAEIAISLNVVLAIFNLVPVYPLDGSKIILAILPKSTAFEYEEFMRKYGTALLLIVLVPWSGQSIVSQFISPLIDLVLRLLLPYS